MSVPEVSVGVSVDFCVVSVGEGDGEADVVSRASHRLCVNAVPEGLRDPRRLLMGGSGVA